jgi:hypothetical protein
MLLAGQQVQSYLSTDPMGNYDHVQLLEVGAISRVCQQAIRKRFHPFFCIDWVVDRVCVANA